VKPNKTVLEEIAADKEQKHHAAKGKASAKVEKDAKGDTA